MDYSSTLGAGSGQQVMAYSYTYKKAQTQESHEAAIYGNCATTVDKDYGGVMSLCTT